MKKNWKTSLTGLMALAMTGISIYSKKTVSPEDLAAVTAGIGLILAKDATVTGTAQ